LLNFPQQQPDPESFCGEGFEEFRLQQLPLTVQPHGSEQFLRAGCVSRTILTVPLPSSRISRKPHKTQILIRD
jgi:hypothetical protein